MNEETEINTYKQTKNNKGQNASKQVYVYKKERKENGNKDKIRKWNREDWRRKIGRNKRNLKPSR
jgi:hypothetical protein